MQLSLFFLAVGINIGVILFIYLRIRDHVRKSTETSHVLDDIRDDVEALVVEINQITDRNVSIIEDRVKQLNKLIADADKRITLMKRENEKHVREVPRYNDLNKPGMKDIEHVRSEQKTSKREQVLDLYRKGFSSGIIASKTGISIGEVELIVSLAAGKEK